LSDAEKITKLKNLGQVKIREGSKSWNNSNENVGYINQFKQIIHNCSNPQFELPQTQLLESVNPNYKSNNEKLNLLKDLVDDKTIWANKGEENNKVYSEDPNDFTHQCVIEYRKILSDNTITQKNKIKAIQEISQKNLDQSTHYMRKFRVNIIDMFGLDITTKDENGNDIGRTKEATKTLETMNDNRKKSERSRVALLQRKPVGNEPDLYCTIKDQIENPKWDNKGQGWTSKKLPAGIEKLRGILADKSLNRWDQLNAIFMYSQIKLAEHRDRENSFFSKPTDKEVTQLYSLIRRISNSWHGHDLTSALKLELNNEFLNEMIPYHFPTSRV